MPLDVSLPDVLKEAINHSDRGLVWSPQDAPWLWLIELGRTTVALHRALGSPTSRLGPLLYSCVRPKLPCFP
jgi:hypothetical protein